MHWWHFVVFGYLVACWAGSICLATVSDQLTHIDVAWSRAVARYPIRMWASFTLVVIFLGPFLPLLLAHCFLESWRYERAWRGFRRTHRVVSFEHLHIANMPKAAQDHIERCEPLLHDLGFVTEGSYRLKPEPVPIYSRCYISPRGESVVDVSLIDDHTAFSFTSVLDNGHVLETACTEGLSATDRINASGRFTAVMVERDSDEDCIASLYQRHQASLVELERRFQSRTLHFDIDQVQAVMSYANCVFGEVRYALGELDAPPSPPTLPAGRAELVPQY